MIIGHPGSWQQFQFRPDNKGLNVMEMKSKYLHEQYLFEAQMLNLQQLHQQNAFMNGAGGGPSPSSEPAPTPTYSTALQLTFNDTLATVTSNYGFDVTSATAWNESGRFLNGSDPSNFEAIDIDNDTNTITLKGNEEGLAVEESIFSRDANLTLIEDLNSNCVNEVKLRAFAEGVLERAVLNAVTTIGADAFYNCSSLTNISFTSLETIPDSSNFELGGVFNGCNLSNLIFDTHLPALIDIGSFAFFGSGLESVSIDSTSLLNIYRNAFSTTSLTSFTFTTTEGNKPNFRERAFQNAENLITLNIPNQVTYEDASVFLNVARRGTGNIYSGNTSDDAILYLSTAEPDGKGWTITPV